MTLYNVDFQFAEGQRPLEIVQIESIVLRVYILIERIVL